MPHWVAGEAGRALLLEYLLDTNGAKDNEREAAADLLGRYASALAREHGNGMLYKKLDSLLKSLKEGESSRRPTVKRSESGQIKVTYKSIKTGQIKVVCAAQKLLRQLKNMPTRAELCKAMENDVGPKVFKEACTALNRIKHHTGTDYSPAPRNS